MISAMNKQCTGFKCEDKDRCPLYGRGGSPYSYISPLSFHEECPYWPPTTGWGDGREEND